jgi:malate dehydrogenase
MRVVVAGGAGGVGTSLAHNLLVGSQAHEIVLIDPRVATARSHAMDFDQVLELGGHGSVRPGGLDDIADADIVVMTASAPLRANASRQVFLHDNAALVAELADVVRAQSDAWPGIVVMVTNPVDPLVVLMQRRSGLDRARVIGYTLNDSLRLRTAIGKRLRTSPGSVDAWTIGEHGDGAVPLLSRVRVNGSPVSLDQREAADVRQWLQDWYVRHVALDSGRSSTWTSGLGIARMVATVAGGDELWTASVMLTGEYGIDGVSLSVPVRLGAGGMREIVEWPLAAEEQSGLRAAASVVAEAAQTLG